ncbi:MAG TPA: heparinase II/III family protein [Opitutaceae bacterium]|jgi:hypothetical protein|nr:heparinase II/III family protein [Opitutaceae bacterium]
MPRLRAFLVLLAAAALTWAVPRAAAADDPLAHLRPGHPRLLFTDEQLAAALAAAKTDPIRADLHGHIIATAESILPTPSLRPNNGTTLQEQQRYAVYHILTCAMAYRLTGDARFAARVKRDLLTLCSFRDWEAPDDLALGENSFAVALGYDWIYSQLGAGERAAIRDALVQKSLNLADDSYRREAGWTLRTSNHNEVCNGGIISAALVVADEEPELVRRVLAGARASLLHTLSGYAPEGAWPEGPGYWTYGTTYAAIAFAELEGALGTDLGLSQAPGFAHTIDYYEAVQGPFERPFNFSDSTDDPQNSPVRAWLAQRYQAPFALRHTRELLAGQLRSERVISFDRAIQGQVTNRFFALHAVWFPREIAGAVTAPPLDAHYAGVADVAVFRGAWHDPRALFVGFKGGAASMSHSHLDEGSFVLDADGQRWAADLGGDTREGTYTLPGYSDTRGRRWTYFRTNNLSHNTVTPGEALQRRNVAAPILTFGSRPKRAFAIVDLTPVYPKEAASLRRGIALLDRARALVQDEYRPIRPDTPLHWAMITPAHASISADGRSVRLAQGGRSLRLDILSPAAARWYAEPASPPGAQERQNEGFTRLSTEAAPADGADSVRLVVLLTPVGEKWPALPAPKIEPLADWR